jgi:hypothetical protein
VKKDDLELMKKLDEMHLQRPFLWVEKAHGLASAAGLCDW